MDGAVAGHVFSSPAHPPVVGLYRQLQTL